TYAGPPCVPTHSRPPASNAMVETVLCGTPSSRRDAWIAGTPCGSADAAAASAPASASKSHAQAIEAHAFWALRATVRFRLSALRGASGAARVASVLLLLAEPYERLDQAGPDEGVVV